MYRNEIRKVIEKVLKGDINKHILMEYLINNC